MKKSVIIGLVILLGVWSMALAGQGRVTASAAETLRGTVEVYGTAEVSAVPNVATVSFGVETAAEELMVAQGDNAQIMTDVLRSLGAFKIAKDQIQTGNYSVSPRYEYTGGVSKKVGYQVHNTVRVKLVDLDRVGEVIDAVTAAGANVFGGIEFSLSDKSACYDDALVLALKSARQKAELIANEQGISLGRTVSVVENSVGESVAYAASPRAMMAMDASAQTPVSSGKILVRASVTVVYETL